jgi:PEGA domain-containing protein
MARFEPFAWGSVITLLVCLNGSVARAADDADREARERYENAVKLYEDGAYDAALVELNRASELRPSYKIYYNIGQVRFAMHDYAAAMDAYHQYLEKGGDKIPAARREQVQKELNGLTQRVAKLVIETDVPGAEVFIDDVSMGVTPLRAPLVVNSGIRRISARHPDYLPQSRKVSIAGGVAETIKFALASAVETGAAAPVTSSGSARAATGAVNPTPPATTAATPQAPQGEVRVPSRSVHQVPWAGWVLTGAFAAGAAVTGVLALSANSSLEDDRGQLDVGAGEVSSRASKVRTLATVTDCLAAAAVISGGVSLWLTLRSSSEPEAQAGSTQARVNALQIGFGPNGINMRGAF